MANKYEPKKFRAALHQSKFAFLQDIRSVRTLTLLNWTKSNFG